MPTVATINLLIADNVGTDHTAITDPRRDRALDAVLAQYSARLRANDAAITTSNIDDMPEHHAAPVAKWVAAELLNQLASYHAGDGMQDLIGAEVQTVDKAAAFAKRAAILQKAAWSALGIPMTQHTTPYGGAVRLVEDDFGQ